MASLITDDEPKCLLDILLSRRGLGVSDAQDITYGHLVIAGFHSSRRAEIFELFPDDDYRKPVPEVFTDAARFVIQLH